MNIVDYLNQHSNTSLKQRPLNALDIACLTEISYLSFSDSLTSSFEPQEGLSLQDLALAYQKRHNREPKELLIAYEARVDLLHHLATSKRFKDVIAFAYSDYFSELEETQFAAISFYLDDRILVVYRGTDSSVIGWKEDFNLSYMESIPSQRLAANYLNLLAQATESSIIVSGHSKGGNLALYAACYSQARANISDVYLFDAPGLQGHLTKSTAFKETLPKIHAFRPQASLVGVLFHLPVETTIIKSYGISAMQHLLFLWQVDTKTCCFVTTDHATPSSRKMQAIANLYLAQASKSDNQTAIDFVWKLFFKKRADKEPFSVRLKNVYSAMASSTKAERQRLLAVLSIFFTSWYTSDIEQDLSDRQKLKPRRMLLKFFYLPEQLASKSPYLGLVTIAFLLWGAYFFLRNQKLNLLVFSSLYLLALLVTGITAIHRWLKAPKRLSFDYLPGIYSIATIVLTILHTQKFSEILPHSMLGFLLLLIAKLLFQSYHIKAYFTEFSKALNIISLLGVVFVLMAYHFPSLMAFVTNQGLACLFLYKMILIITLTYRSFRARQM